MPSPKTLKDAWDAALSFAEDASWLRTTLAELSPVKPWVKPVENGFHLVEGKSLPTLFVSFNWTHQRDAQGLKAILVEHRWPLF